MTSREIREKYLKFFQARGHKIIPPAPLIPKDDPTTLFTTAGMQPLVPYLLGEPHPEGKRLVDIQPCLRTDDIDEVGDNTHNTFLEMMGNWSLGDYWKTDSLKWSLEFLTEELNLPKEKLAVTVFAGDSDAPRDEESIEIWKSLGIAKNRIFPLGKKDNWWGPVGDSGPCGPDSEIFFWTGEGEPKKSPDTNPLWVEVWNNVFMEYNKAQDGNFEPLKQRNVDTGIGVERTTTVVQGKTNVYETDLFFELYEEIKDSAKAKMNVVGNQRVRIFLDHSRASFFLIREGIRPGQKERDYILRRLIRRANDQLTLLFHDVAHTEAVIWWEKALSHYKETFNGIYEFDNNTLNTIKSELEKYGEIIHSNAPKVEPLVSTDEVASKQVLAQNSKKYFGTPDFSSLIEKNRFTSLPSVAAGSVAFDAQSTLGFPAQGSQGTVSIAEAKLGNEFNREEFDKTFHIFSQQHQDVSRASVAGMFKGGLASTGETETKYHTATHLLHAALRQTLGDHVLQRGSNINAERLRFDFSHPGKLTEEQLKEVEDLVNEQIDKDIPVTSQEMTREEAYQQGAIGAFGQKYGDRVTVYTIGRTSHEAPRGAPFSREFCGGPHVESTGSIGHVRIIKEESAGAGIRRIYAEVIS
ncbi:MAG: alanine--tRNA ligase-related protein [Patescibacteria group bacterium]